MSYGEAVEFEWVKKERLLNQLLAILSRHANENGAGGPAGEGAVETLERLVRQAERGETMTAAPGNFMTKHWSIDMARADAGNVSVNRVDLEWLARTAALVDLETVERRVDLTNTILANAVAPFPHPESPRPTKESMRGLVVAANAETAQNIRDLHRGMLGDSRIAAAALLSAIDRILSERDDAWTEVAAQISLWNDTWLQVCRARWWAKQWKVVAKLLALRPMPPISKRQAQALLSALGKDPP